MGGASCSYLLRILHAPTGLSIIVDAQLYFLLFIPLAHYADRRVFSRELWRVPRAIWIPIPIVALMQVCIESATAPLPSADPYTILGALLLAPFVEELIRAVMMLAFAEKFGAAFNIALTAFLTATVHEFFWIAFLMQTVLCIMFWKSRKSLPTAMLSHLTINLIAIFNVRLQAFR